MTKYERRNEGKEALDLRLQEGEGPRAEAKSRTWARGNGRGRHPEDMYEEKVRRRGRKGGK